MPGVWGQGSLAYFQEVTLQKMQLVHFFSGVHNTPGKCPSVGSGAGAAAYSVQSVSAHHQHRPLRCLSL